MISTSSKVSFILLLFLGHYNLFCQEQVFVEAASEGQGIMRAKENDCFVITPYHVIKETAGNFNVIGPYQKISTVNIERQYETADLAILKVLAGEILCEEWLELENFDVMLKTQTGGHLIIREIDGSTSPIPVEFINVGDEFLTIQPVDKIDGLREGMSGSTLLVNGANAGLLLRVDVENQSGTILRRDVIQRLTDTFFKIPEEKRNVTDVEKDRIATYFGTTFYPSLQGLVFVNSELITSDNKKNLFFGEEPNDLRYELDLNALSIYLLDINVNHYNFPFNPAAERVYYQLKFGDGTYSDIKIKENKNNRQVFSLQIPSKNEKDAPVLLFKYEASVDPGSLIWETPINTLKVFYSFDKGGFFETESLSNNSLKWKPEESYFKLKFKLLNGQEIGPFEYNLSSINQFLRSETKAIFENFISNVFRCSKNAQEDGEITCLMNYLGLRNNTISLSSVLEFRFGNTPNNLSYIVPVDISPVQIRSGQGTSILSKRLAEQKIQNVNNQLYCQVLFFDGSKSDVFRLPLINP